MINTPFSEEDWAELRRIFTLKPGWHRRVEPCSGCNRDIYERLQEQGATYLGKPPVTMWTHLEKNYPEGENQGIDETCTQGWVTR